MRNTVLAERAKRLRSDATRVEGLLWGKLRNRQLGGWKWRRQVAIGRYIADFACVENLLIIELDGGQHSDATVYDERRSEDLAQLGWRVMRFWNHEVLADIGAVCDQIYAAHGPEAPSPNPLPRGGEG
jgi:very-short-patch-repair endonuclease